MTKQQNPGTGTVRCAIYTRKSTEDGLEQDFNSLHAQREACEAFALSQKAAGWKVSKKTYDDGGFSGGSMVRPALNELMKDINEGRVDLILVYKIDRLTRSLSDFSRLVDLFDEKKVSFVSVTQQFNTNTSMGRLTLNMLLSFAQFEREVTSERIRDKFAASKKKGMWMGGLPPLGYEVHKRSLRIVREEAVIIRDIFASYLRLGTVRKLKDYIEVKGYRSKHRPHNDIMVGNKPISQGNLRQMIKNPLYKGSVRHKNNIYDGLHEAIIDPETFDKVQEKLAAYRPRHEKTNDQSGNILKGLIYDETGDLLTTVYTRRYTPKGMRKYRFYVSSRSVKNPNQKGWRLPAKEIEEPILRAAGEYILKDTGFVRDIAGKVSPEELHTVHETIKSATLGTNLCECIPLIKRVDIEPGMMTIKFDTQALSKALNLPDNLNDEDFSVLKTFSLRKRGIEQRLVFGDIPQDKKDESLIEILRKSQSWLQGLNSGDYSSLKDIAEQTGTDRTDISRYLPLAFLNPKIRSDILDGRQPVTLTLESLKSLGPLPLDFKEQRTLLGY